MSAGTVADMLADLLAPTASADPEGTAANAANSANRERWRGLQADSGVSERLRISANPSPQAPEAAPDSQVFAGIRNPATRPDRKHWRGDSQDSQDSQGADSGNASAARALLMLDGAPITHRDAEAIAHRLLPKGWRARQ